MASRGSAVPPQAAATTVRRTVRRTGLRLRSERMAAYRGRGGWVAPENENDAFRFEVRATCGATLACGDGAGARDLRSWSFVDDRSPMEAEETGEMDYSTRDVPWPSPVYVRVYRAIGAGDCSRYQLRATR